MDYRRLATEVWGDPLGRGYSRMTPREITESLRAVDRAVPRGVIQTHEVVAVLVAGDRGKISDSDLRWLSIVLTPPQIDISNPGIQALLVDILAASTGSKDGIMELATRTISRAEEIGVEDVQPEDVKRALAMRVTP